MNIQGQVAAEPQGVAAAPQGHAKAMALAALGVVFGDIGTSPLYTLKIVLAASGHQVVDRAMVLGSLSLIIWTLIIVTSVKYIAVAMRVDNHGEGGIMALMALLSGGRKGLGGRRQRRTFVVIVGLAGAALIYGDGVITPAISVLSALEGLAIKAHSFEPYILPATIVILVLLFLVQPRGTATIGRLFGPIMLVWFATLGLLGIGGIWENPDVLAAINPAYGLYYLFEGGLASFLILGGVFLCVTGAEALYTDMGHFGRRPIQMAWFFIVFPCLVLNYAGQAALVLDGTAIAENTFYALCPRELLIPLIVLATIATIVASQAVITGAFSMTRQAIQLGWLPRLHITQTSALGFGQIYIGVVNWTMMVVTIGLTLSFREADNLAAAYGIAVSATMLMDSFLLYIAMREYLGWDPRLSALLAGCFIIVDCAFVIANSAKMLDGAWVPLLLAAIIAGLMWVWHSGRRAVMAVLVSRYRPIHEFLAELKETGVPRVPGTAVFMTRSKKGVPPVMSWHVKHNRALHERVVVVHVSIEPVPFVNPEHRLHVETEDDNFWRAMVYYGFMERPDIPPILELVKERGYDINLDDVTYYIGRETVVAREDGKGLPRWQENIFSIMERNAAQVTDFFRLPVDRVVEIGRQVAI
ncbi:potassium transporter Kup [Rhodomicrobium udaipurense JA643]|uniref:Probable potassium transport system protein Kup n=1 Tax=Rhodomicrobium udaipurense TaxID=1202716 RepID=A0A8I1GF57_9HYPH|nr:potassium transporter Kup [Rhodomicrobium udaipurense]KAI94968.1 potassium transporter Kup [Rhodomicrobium udaipurense JA643]MBJ7544905.1 potassium transporter Kup [Rhodomicrobium udaipurense]